MKQIYVDTISLVERLHRRFLDVIKTELDRLGVDDINNIQTLILYNISDEQLTIGELTNRGYYLGSNVSYNVKKLVENSYLVQERAPHDKRSTRIRLSDKGLTLCQQIDELYQNHSSALSAPGANPSIDALRATNDTLNELEQFWSDYISRMFKH